MLVCLILSLPEPDVELQLAGAGGTEWKSLENEMNSIRYSRGIKTGDSGNLKSWLGIGYSGFGEDRHIWAGTDMW